MVKKITAKISQNQLLGGSFVLLVGSVIGNFGNYLYHLLMGRMLGPSDYGTLISLISLIYITGVPFGILSLLVVKYISSLTTSLGLGAAHEFYSKIANKLLPLAILGFVLLSLLSPLINSFLNLNATGLIIMVIFFSVFGVFVNLNSATLQGLLYFKLNSVISIVQSLSKLILAFVLVYFGFKVFGAISAVLINY